MKLLFYQGSKCLIISLNLEIFLLKTEKLKTSAIYTMKINKKKIYNFIKTVKEYINLNLSYVK